MQDVMQQIFYRKGKQMGARILFAVIALLVLPGCLGQALLDESPPEDLPKVYPLLGSVPERPPKDDMRPVKSDLKEAEGSYQEYLDFNQQLREQYGLSVGEKGGSEAE